MQNINHSVYLSIISTIGLFSVVYVCFTCMPILWLESPYNTPLSLITYIILKGITLFLIFTLLLCLLIAEVMVGIVVILIVCLAACSFLIIAIIIFGCLAPFTIVFLCSRLVCGAHRFSGPSPSLNV